MKRTGEGGGEDLTFSDQPLASEACRTQKTHTQGPQSVEVSVGPQRINLKMRSLILSWVRYSPTNRKKLTHCTHNHVWIAKVKIDAKCN